MLALIAPGPAGALVKIDPDYKAVSDEFTSEHKEEANYISQIFVKALTEAGKTEDSVEQAYFKAITSNEEFLEKARDQLLEEIKHRSSNADGVITVKLYTDMLRDLQNIAYDGASKVIDDGIRLRRANLEGSMTLVDKAIEVKMKLLVQERERTNTIIARNEAIEKAELARREFEENQHRLNIQQQADILQKRYDSLLEAYKKEIDIAKDILAKNHKNYQLVTVPPRIEGDTVIPGKVSCDASDPGLCLIM